MADEKPPAPFDLEIPDLVLPDVSVPKAGPKSTPQIAPRSARPTQPTEPELDDVLDLSLDRGHGPISGAADELQPPPSSRRALPAAKPSASGLDVGYDRVRAERERAAAMRGPGLGLRVAAVALPLVFGAGTAVALAYLLHRPGGVPLLLLYPRAFDARSLVASLAVVTLLFLSSLAVAFVALRKTTAPRSKPLIAAAVVLLAASLAMVTVALAATEENPMPADGALLIPWLVPLAGVLIAASALVRARRDVFVDGATPKLMAVARSVAAGAVLFAALEASALAALLPAFR